MSSTTKWSWSAKLRNREDDTETNTTMGKLGETSASRVAMVLAYYRFKRVIGVEPTTFTLAT